MLFVHQGIRSADKRVKFVNGRLSFIIRGLWCDIIILNVHSPAEDKITDTKDRFYVELEHVFNQFLRYHTKMLLEDSSLKVGRENIFKPTIRNESLHEISNDNGVKVVNFATSKYLIVREYNVITL
jgi:hypothetical protein